MITYFPHPLHVGPSEPAANKPPRLTVSLTSDHLTQDYAGIRIPLPIEPRMMVLS
jgi:hypothetical protein